MRTELIVYRDSDPGVLEALVKNTKLPRPFLAEDRVAKLGEIVFLRIEGDNLLGTVDHELPLPTLSVTPCT